MAWALLGDFDRRMYWPVADPARRQRGFSPAYIRQSYSGKLGAKPYGRTSVPSRVRSCIIGMAEKAIAATTIGGPF